MAGPRKPRPKPYGTVFAPGHTDMPVQPYRTTGIVRPARVPDGDYIGTRPHRISARTELDSATIGRLSRLSEDQIAELIEHKVRERWHSSYSHVPGLPLRLRLAVITLPFIGMAGIAYMLQWLRII